MTTWIKNKIQLSDYDYKKDIETRLLIADFSSFDLEVLEEILFSPLKTPIENLLKNFDADKSALIESLTKLEKTSLFTLTDEFITVDKEMRKHFEFQLLKFNNDFKPGMDFLQGLLKKAPIHVLPTWYAIPRSSNDIFASIVEKYLYTPTIFERHLAELTSGDPIIGNIIQDVYSSKDFKVSARQLQEKYDLGPKDFAEYTLLLEFNFACCLSYCKIGDKWEAMITPFYEWKKYLEFIKNTTPASIKNMKKDEPDFSFIQKMKVLLKQIERKPFPLKNDYIEKKIVLLQFADIKKDHLHISKEGKNWLLLTEKEQAIYIYRHPKNKLLSFDLDKTNRNLWEAEKSLSRVVDSGWVYLEDYLKGIMVTFNEKHGIHLEKKGKHWCYTLPDYDETDKQLFASLVTERLMEVGMVKVAKHKNHDCFTVTPFGKSFFES